MFADVRLVWCCYNILAVQFRTLRTMRVRERKQFTYMTTLHYTPMSERMKTSHERPKQHRTAPYVAKTEDSLTSVNGRVRQTMRCYNQTNEYYEQKSKLCISSNARQWHGMACQSLWYTHIQMDIVHSQRVNSANQTYQTHKHKHTPKMRIPSRLYQAPTPLCSGKKAELKWSDSRAPIDTIVVLVCLRTWIWRRRKKWSQNRWIATVCVCTLLATE